MEKKIKEKNYADFHFANMGFEFEEKYSKKRFSKLQMFLKTEDKKELELLTDNRHHMFIKVSKKGYDRNGNYIYCNSTTCFKKFECYRYNNRNLGRGDAQVFVSPNHCGMFEFDYTKK